MSQAATLPFDVRRLELFLSSAIPDARGILTVSQFGWNQAQRISRQAA
jgi:hypothetical protein